MEQPTLEQLSDWLLSPTTDWFFSYVTHEWGPSGVRYQQAVRDAAQNQNAVVELQKVLYAQECMTALIHHPANVLKTKKQEARTAAGMALGMYPSRRGPGL